jgi:hypothetical protein
MNRLKNFLLISLMLTCFSSCEEIFEEENEEAGREYLEFKVDGKSFESVSNSAQCTGLDFHYFPEPYLDLSPGFMEMVSRNCSDSTSLSLTFQRVTPEYTGTSSLETPNFANSFKPELRFENNMVFNRLLDGNITINQFSGSSKKGSGRLTGTFEMRLIDSEKSDTISITDGKFNFFIERKLH